MPFFLFPCSHCISQIFFPMSSLKTSASGRGLATEASAILLSFSLFSRRAGRRRISGVLYVQIASCHLCVCFCTPAPCLPAPDIAQPWLRPSSLLSGARAAYQHPAEPGCARGGRRSEGPHSASLPVPKSLGHAHQCGYLRHT